MNPMLQRISALVLLGVALMLLWTIAAMPYQQAWGDKLQQIQHQQRKIASLQSLVNRENQLKNDLQQAKQKNDLDKLFLAQNKGPLAEIRLQKIVKSVVASKRARLLQAVKKRSRHGEPVANDKTITLQLSIQGDLAQIYAVLHAFDQHQPLIRSSNLEINMGNSRYQYASQSTKFYRASFDVSAFIQ